MGKSKYVKSNREKCLEQNLGVLLDSIDFERGNCKPNQMIGQLVDHSMLANARMALVETNN